MLLAHQIYGRQTVQTRCYQGVFFFFSFEFIPKINWFLRGKPCFPVQGMTFRANRGMNFIKKIYENESGIKFHSAPIINYIFKKYTELSSRLFFLIIMSILYSFKSVTPYNLGWS